MTRLEVLVVLALLLTVATLLGRCGAGGVHYDVYIETHVVIDDDGCGRVLFDLHCACGRRRYREVGPPIDPTPAVRGALPPLLMSRW